MQPVRVRVPDNAVIMLLRCAEGYNFRFFVCKNYLT